MDGFVEKKVRSLSGLKRGVSVILWFCSLFFLLPGVAIIAKIMTDTEPAPGEIYGVLAFLFAVGALIAFIAIRRGRQSARVKKSPYSFVHLFGCDEDVETVAKAFNNERLDFEYANSIYIAGNYLLVVEGYGVCIAKISSVIHVYYEKMTKHDLIIIRGNFSGSASTYYVYRLFFKGSEKPMIVTAMNQNDVPMLTDMFQMHGLTVETDKTLYKLASKDYDEFEKECVKRKA